MSLIVVIFFTENVGKASAFRVYSVKTQTEIMQVERMLSSTGENMVHYAKLPYALDIVVKIASSVVLDSALDKLTVNIAEEGLVTINGKYREKIAGPIIKFLEKR